MKWLGLVGAVAFSVGLVTLVADTDRPASKPHPAAYYHYVVTYIDGWSISTDPQGPARDRAWAKTHRAAVMADGDRACRWLAEQPSAGRVDPTGRTGVEAMATRYIRQAPRLPVEEHRRSTLPVGAWAYLCLSVRDDKTAPRSLHDD
jgi:hypothetical protein